MTLHDRLLAEVERRKALAAAAMPGPWEFYKAAHDVCVQSADRQWVIYYTSAADTADEVARQLADAAFIAAHDPADALRRYERDLKTLARHYESMHDWGGGACSDDAKDWPCEDILDLATGLDVEVSDG